MVDRLSSSRNIFFGGELTIGSGFLDLMQMREIAMKVLETAVNISGIDIPDQLVGGLSAGRSRRARAVFFKRRFLLLDEPT